MVVGFLSLPMELTCHILLFLAPRDISRCTTVRHFPRGFMFFFLVKFRFTIDLQVNLQCSPEFSQHSIQAGALCSRPRRDRYPELNRCFQKNAFPRETSILVAL